MFFGESNVGEECGGVGGNFRWGGDQLLVDIWKRGEERGKDVKKGSSLKPEMED